MRKAEIGFYEEIVKILKQNKKFELIKVGGDNRTPFIEFKGEDLGDMSFDGLLHIVVDHNEVLVYASANTVMRGKQEYSQRKRLGVFSVADAVEVIEDLVGLRR
jgi:hypothetical protein